VRQQVRVSSTGLRCELDRLLLLLNWFRVSIHERKGRPLHTPQTNRVVNIAACHLLEQAVSKRNANMFLPDLDAAIAAVVDEAEDGAPLIVSHDVSESMFGGATAESDSEGEEPDSEGEEPAQLAAAQRDLYADWSERDHLLR